VWPTYQKRAWCWIWRIRRPGPLPDLIASATSSWNPSPPAVWPLSPRLCGPGLDPPRPDPRLHDAVAAQRQWNARHRLTLMARRAGWSCGYDDHNLPPVRAAAIRLSHRLPFRGESALTPSSIAASPAEASSSMSAARGPEVTTEAASFAWLVAGKPCGADRPHAPHRHRADRPAAATAVGQYRRPAAIRPLRRLLEWVRALIWRNTSPSRLPGNGRGLADRWISPPSPRRRQRHLRRRRAALVYRRKVPPTILHRLPDPGIAPGDYSPEEALGTALPAAAPGRSSSPISDEPSTRAPTTRALEHQPPAPKLANRCGGAGRPPGIGSVEHNASHDDLVVYRPSPPAKSRWPVTRPLGRPTWFPRLFALRWPGQARPRRSNRDRPSGYLCNT